MMERVWTILAALSLLIAAILLLRDNMTAAFVAATLGVVGWFMGLRDRLRKTVVTAIEPQERDHNTNGDRDED